MPRTLAWPLSREAGQADNPSVSKVFNPDIDPKDIRESLARQCLLRAPAARTGPSCGSTTCVPIASA
ncbi:hypothetical protein GCM10011316_14910 [Roseibium aquae]|uniref:Uncharacterized protein n=1 Tax=Roseibium aquae TaxID=1323746 RepID=A0A916TGH3_9HYPH|nr:hypothetical protein GCM10011316_14910 [Roseibium aquae]